MIPASFDVAANFEGNFAVVKEGEKTGMISSSGKQLIPCMYRNINIFSSNLIAVKEKDLWGLVDSANIPLLPQEYRPLMHALVDENNQLLLRVQQRARQNHLLLNRSVDLMERFINTLVPGSRAPTYDEAGHLFSATLPSRPIYEAVG